MFKRSVFFVAVALYLLTNGCNNATSEKIAQKQTPQQDILEVLGTDPDNPAEMVSGQKLNVHIFYQLNITETAQIWARPYKNGQKAPGYKAHHLIPVDSKKENSGFVTGWFFFDKPAEIDEVRVFMRNSATEKIIKRCSYRVYAKWAACTRDNCR